MEGQRRRPTAPRAKKPAAKRATTEPKGTVAARSRAGNCVPQRGARSRRAECDGDSAEKPRAQAPRARSGRASVRTKDPQPSATGAAGDAEQPRVREPPPPTVPRTPEVARGVREPPPPTVPEAPEVARGVREPPLPTVPRTPEVARGVREPPPPTVPRTPEVARGVREPPPPTVPRTPEVARGVREPPPPTVPKAPEVARGPCGRRGARSTGQQRASRASRKEPETLDKKLKRVLGNLRLRRDEISVAAEVVNEVVKCLLKGMQTRDSEFKGVQPLNTGSYYEHVKISAPNEFDVMFKLEVPRIDLQEYHDTGAFYRVKFKRIPGGNPLRHFLEGEILSASKMLSRFREIIKKEVKKIEGIDVTVEKEKPGSPAVTLLIRNPEEISVDIILALESKGSWPQSTNEGLPIKNWLGTKVRTNLRREPFYLVPKNAKVGNDFQGKTWRLSFSHTEKYILSNHGIEKTCCESAGVKCCRKDCLKLMKYLLEQLKKEWQELDGFCSYHVKTAVFHMWTENPQDSHWDPKQLSTCFDEFLTFFVECLRTEKLMHYFIPKFNLFSQEEIDQKSKEFLLEKIEYERNNGFPIFDKF